ncbi:Coronatine-insensitive protein 1 [Glycine soja]
MTIAPCYTTMLDRLRRRFLHLKSLKLKGKPREAMFKDWGGFVTTLVIDISQYFNCLKSLHFRHMIVRDSDLEVVARSRGHILQALKLDKCSGFSTDGLYYIDRYCR